MSIYGIGVDICEIKRVEKIYLKHGQSFINKLLNASEQKQMYDKKSPSRFLAKRFAAKEAFAKALGTGVAQGVTLPDIEICHNHLGKPELKLHGKTDKMVKALGEYRLHLSVSDEKFYAVAQVVIELA
ncbi:MAG: holo-ACP synthase [Gammaproteobacteria bacterium]|nr:holo-ACP synthase [Gammaproteobacteria bacterium]MDH5628544.1 holo-ACP synthase [Gammaproteobacteria bacterium]